METKPRFEEMLHAVGGVQGVTAAMKAGNAAPLELLIDAGKHDAQLARIAHDSTEKQLALAQRRERLYMHYLGVLGLLCEVAVYVPAEDREMITVALDEACSEYPLRWRRILNRFEIEPVPDRK